MGSQRSSSRRWRALVPVVCLVAGLGFAASARASRGTELRAPGIASLADTVRAAQTRAHSADHQLVTLQHDIDRITQQSGSGDGQPAAAQQALSRLRARGGLVAAHGAGLTVVLNDAVQADGDPIAADAGIDPNQLVVHQSDLQSVVNALWAGGAEAVSIAGQRVIATSALRCVGNTLLLNGELFSPPYRVDAIGPAAPMQRRLDLSPGVSLFREAAGYYGLGYTVESQRHVSVPSYRGTAALVYAHAGR